jgi:predicted DNA-binding protein (UPF0251 family)
MPRKTKCRKVAHIPRSNIFKPAGIPACDLAETVLKIEEAEALRLKDLLGLEQVDCAAEMGVSRTTFQRILVDARQKVADALINSKVLVLEGGHYELVNECRHQSQQHHRCGYHHGGFEEDNE